MTRTLTKCSRCGCRCLCVRRCRSSPVRPLPAGRVARRPAQGQGGRGGGGGGFGGCGNLKVLLITKGHPYDREPFYQLFDQPPVGTTARWTHVEQPAAEIFFDPALAKDYDVFVFYDLDGSQPDRRRPRVDKAGKPVMNKDGSPAFTWDPPPADLVANTKALLRQGKPMIFLHHASASWAHSWPEFTEVMGIACDWGQPLRVRNLDHPKSGFFGRTSQTHHRRRQGASDYAGTRRQLRDRGRGV